MPQEEELAACTSGVCTGVDPSSHSPNPFLTGFFPVCCAVAESEAYPGAKRRESRGETRLAHSGASTLPYSNLVE